MHTHSLAPGGRGKIPFGIFEGMITKICILGMTLFRHILGICVLLRDGIANSLLLIRDSIKVATIKVAYLIDFGMTSDVGYSFRLAGATGGPGIIFGGFAPPEKAFSLRVGRPDGGRVTILQKSALVVIMIMAVILFSGFAQADTGDGTPQNSLFVSMHTDQPIDGQITETIIQTGLSEIMVMAQADKVAWICWLRSATDKCFNQRPKKTKKPKTSGAVAKMVGTIEQGGKLVKGEMHDDIPFGPVAKMIGLQKLSDGGHIGPLAKCLSLEQETSGSTKLVAYL